MGIRQFISGLTTSTLANSTIDEIAAFFLGLPPILNKCITVGNQTYLYENQVWIPAPDRLMEDLVRLAMCKCQYRVGQNGSAPVDTPTWRVRSVVAAIQAHTRAPAEAQVPLWVGPGHPTFHPEKSICFQDAVYDLSTSQWHDRPSNWLDPVVLPCTRAEVEGAPDPTTFLSCMERWAGEDPEWGELLMRMTAYTLMPYRDFQRAFLMVGKRRAGKGVWARFMRKSMGALNVFSTDMEKFAYTHGLEGADTSRLILVNEVGETEVSVPAQMRRKLNEVIGRDETRLNPKGVRTYGAVLPGAILMVGNDLPDIEDPSDSFWSKVVILPYRVSFLDKEDLNLEDRLWADRAGIYRMILEAGSRLLIEGRFPKVQSADSTRSALKRHNSPIDAFIDDRCDLNSKKSETKDDLYEAFKNWCSFYDVPEMSRIAFFKKIHSSTHPLRVVKRGPKGNQVVRIAGIGLSPLKHQEED